MRHRSLFNVAVFGTWMLTPLGCGVLLGTDDYSTAGHGGAGREGAEAGSSTASGIGVTDVDCNQCLRDECEVEMSACAADPECAAFAGCWFGCPLNDARCQGSCVETVSRKPPAMGALWSCEARRCPSCMDCTQSFSALGGATCGECIGNDDGPGEACELQAQCAADAECLAYVACLLEECDDFAHDPKCRLTCGGGSYAGARMLYSQVGTRFFSACAEQCRAGEYWDCVQPTPWPASPRPAETVSVTLNVGDRIASGTIPRACRNRDLDCASPVESSSWDAGSGVVFPLQTVEFAGDGYYFEYETNVTGAFPTQLFVPWQPLVDDITFGLVPVETPPSDDGASSSSGVGRLTVWVVDCIGGLADWRSLAPAVTVNVGEQHSPPKTIGAGVYSFDDLPPPSTVVEVFLDGDRIAVATVPVRAGGQTTVTFNYPQMY